MRQIAFVCAVFLTTAAVADEPAWPFAETTKAPAGPPVSKPEMDAALRYLDKNAGSREAPRVAFDVLIAATVAGDAATADDMRLRLALDHSKSIYSRYALVTSQPQAYRELLKKAATERPMTRTFADRFLVAVKAGIGQWNSQFFSDHSFLLHCALACRLTGDKELHEQCKTRLLAPNPVETATALKLRKTAEILFETSVSDAETSLRFHAVEHPVAAKLAEYFDAQLPETERSTPELMEARIERLLERNRFADARPTIDALIRAHGTTAKRLFWQGTCQLATGDPAAAATFNSSVQQFPDDDWAGPAAQAATAAAAFDANLDEHVEAIAALIRETAAMTVEQIELTAEVAPGDLAPFSIYFGGRLTDGNYELSLRRNGQWLTAVHRGSSTTKLLVEGDSSVHLLPDRKLIGFPQPVLHVDPDAEKHFNFKFNWNLGKDVSQTRTAAASTEGTLASLQRLTPWQIRLVLVSQVRRGWTPVTVVEDGEGRVYSWLRFGVRQPATRAFRVHVDSDQRLTRIEAPGFTIRQLKYGEIESFEMDPPEWPALPVVRHKSIEPSIFFRVMGAAARILSAEEPLATAEATGGARR